MKCYDIKSEENLLPDITDTEIFKDYENNQSDYMRCIYFFVYSIVKKRKLLSIIFSNSLREYRVCKT